MNIIPKPKKLSVLDEIFCISYQTCIVIDPSCGKNVFYYAGLLQESILKATGIQVKIVKGEKRTNDIMLSVSSDLKEQEYQLTIQEGGCSLLGGDEAGLLYAVQTFRQVLSQSSVRINGLLVEDKPDMENRGFYHDITRGKVPNLKTLKKLADRMSYYKMNEMQLYVEHTYLFRDFSEVWRDETPITAEEILELDEYCQKLHIDLVPSLAAFGHMYKILSTQSFVKYCEFPELREEPFSFPKRMQHHTVNVSDEGTMPFIKRMVKEYMDLFSSKKFNLCADETFDLGKGKSAELAKEKGVDRIYIDFVKELSEFVLENGKIPMFWGDIVVGFPELLAELPKEIICLNWGYLWNQREYETEVIAKAGANQYLCPGCGGWNEWVNLHHNAYENIQRMCTYAMKHQAMGVLNTDWGDFGHINQPEFSVPTMIYGAAFSWNSEILPYEEINRQISVVEYGDSNESFMESVAKIEGNTLFGWYNAVVISEFRNEEPTEEKKKEIYGNIKLSEETLAKTEKNLCEAERAIQENIATISPALRKEAAMYLLAVDAIRIWNQVGAFYLNREVSANIPLCIDGGKLAERLETWFMEYKKLWRVSNGEGDLPRIANVVFFFADFLRK